MEGRSHEVKRLWESQGITVSRLIRVRFGPVILSRSSRVGTVRELDDKEIDELYKWLDIKPDISSVTRNKSVTRPTRRKKSPGRKKTSTKKITARKK
jgi:23S rRNA pseudouridine2605 synthase